MQKDNLELKAEYDECIQKVNSLTNLVKLLSSQYELESLEEVIIPEDYLGLLANSLYAVHSLTYAHCSLKGIDLPQEFAKVKQYYAKAKNPLNPNPSTNTSNPNPIVINKEAVKRVIQRSIN